MDGSATSRINGHLAPVAHPILEAAGEPPHAAQDRSAPDARAGGTGAAQRDRPEPRAGQVDLEPAASSQAASIGAPSSRLT
jgi:hypothetical protein